MTTALTTTAPSLITQRGDDLEVSAFQPQEMREANAALILWCDRKIESLKTEAADLLTAFQQAVQKKWKSSTLKRHADIAAKRVEFYSKMKTALEHGYYIVPNFPVTCFAIRTDAKKPLAMVDMSRWSRKEQQARCLEAGEGEYKNPFPVIYERDITTAEQRAKNDIKKQYFAEEFQAIDFPIQMAKPHIIEATTRAMALKVFDDFGILPQARKQDPLIVGRLKDPRGTKYNQKWITFIIAWHLDTRVL